MGLWSRLTSPFRKGSSDVVGSEIADAFKEWGASSSGLPVNSITALQHTAVMACVSILAEDVAKLPLRVYRRLDNGGKAPARDHYLHRLLRRPNPWQTRLEFVETMQAALVLRGNAYAVILRDERGKPTSLVPIHPDRVTLYEAPGSEYFFWVTAQGLHEMAVLSTAAVASATSMMFHSDDIFHVRWLSSWNSLLGVSRVQLMREAIGLGMSYELQAGFLARNGARPGGFLATDQKLVKEVKERIKADWQQAYGGIRNTGNTAVLEQGLKWEALGMTNVDAEFMASRAFQLQDIARGFRVPLYKLGVPSEGTGPQLAQEEQGYLNNVLSAYCDRWIAKAEQTFGLDGEELFLEFDYTHHLKADIGTRYGAYRTAVVGGFMSINEVRRAEGLPDDPKGNVLLQPANMVPLGTPPAAAAAGPGSDTTGKPGAGGDGDPARLPGDDPAPSV